ncbi:MAG: hypothetical protein LIP77_06455 [Planctomycetes bacterium]|nr:hypothetical protein [Planctomycetota bacterium]
MITDEKLQSILENGETIRWSGNPKPYSLFDESRKRSTIITISVAVATAVILAGGYYAMTVSSGTEMKSGFLLFLLTIGLLIVWGPIADRIKVKKLSYVITDRNVISLSTDNDAPVVLPLADVDAVRVDQGDNGNCHVRLGTAVFRASPKRLPVLAYRGEYDDLDGGKKYKGLVLFNIDAEEGKTVDALLRPAGAAATE